MPEQAINWQASTDSCTFEIKGLAQLGMQIIERTPNTSIIMKGEGKIPFGFMLNSIISAVNELSCTVQLVMDADMNPFISMMAERPLSNFINILVSKLKEVLEK